MFIKRDNLFSVADIVERNTGLSSGEFLNPKAKPYIHNLKEAAECIRSYLKSHTGCEVVVVGDYDADGITASSIIKWMFTALRVNAKIRIPRRMTEGYGLSEKIVDELPEGDNLMVTVDNGISSYNAIKKAKEKGYTVVVTDHHLPPTDKDGNVILPPADVILNPHVNPELSEFEDYCGAGLAYRLAEELLPHMNLVQLLVLASIGTVADVMPLVGANRHLVVEGLKAINKRQCVAGLNAIINAVKLDNHIKEDDFGFSIGPVFNASGRLYDDGAGRVVSVLTSPKTDWDLPDRAEKLVQVNNIRKSLVREAMARVRKNLTGERPIVVYDGEIREGIIGIIAGQLTEEYNCPCIVFTDSENGKLKGSGRSIPEIHLKDVLDRIQDKMTGYGGHAGAAGLSIEKERLPEFTEAFKNACGQIPEKSGDVYYDLELPDEPDDYGKLARELAVYAPYGEGNPKILFHKEFDVSDAEYRVIGDGTHFMIKADKITLMGFGLKDRYETAGKPLNLECVGYFSESWFNGRCSYKFEIMDFLNGGKA